MTDAIFNGRQGTLMDVNASPAIHGIVVEPGCVKTVGLGMHRTSDPLPEFELSFEPEMQDLMGASLDRLDIAERSTCMLLYQFHNYGKQSCHVTIRKVPAEAA